MSAPTIPDWINAGAAAIGALAVVVGLFGARNTIAESRRTARVLRRSQVAEELIALSFNADDALKDMRNPFDSIPAEKAKDKLYAYEKRYERAAKYNDLFRSLRDAQIRARAVIGDAEVDKAVETLFRARARVATAIELLADYARDGAADLEQEERGQLTKLRKDLYGSYSERDELGREILGAIKAIEAQLNPVARLEATK